MPDSTKFSYHVNKRRTHENVDIMRQAEKNLDLVWKEMDRELSRYGQAFRWRKAMDRVDGEYLLM